MSGLLRLCPRCKGGCIGHAEVISVPVPGVGVGAWGSYRQLLMLSYCYFYSIIMLLYSVPTLLYYVIVSGFCGMFTSLRVEPFK